MNKKRKYLSLILCMLLFAVSTFSGCGEASNVNNNDEAVISSEDDAESGADDVSSEDTSQDDEIVVELPTIDEQVLVDNNGLKITAKEFITDSEGGDGIKVLIENNSDTKYLVTGAVTRVNGINVDITGLMATFEAGSNTENTVYISSDILRNIGIETVGSIIFRFICDDFDEDSLGEKSFREDNVELKTSEYANVDSSVTFNGTELYNDNGMKISAIKAENILDDSEVIIYFVECTTDEEINMMMYDQKINGIDISKDEYYSNLYAMPNEKYYTAHYYSYEMEDCGINEPLETIEFRFELHDENTWDVIDEVESVVFNAQ